MRFSFKMTCAAAALALFPSALAAQPASQQRGVRIGTLQCDVSAGLGLILGSSREVDCTFRPARGRTERYVGSIRHLGLDVGATARGVMIWTVVAPSRPVPNAMAGSYVGASAEASLGLGIGANALIGGSSESIALQPVSVQAQVGINAAIGVAELTLRAVEAAPVRRGELR